MKRLIKKRLVYRNLETNEIYYGAEEYDGNLPNWAILNTVYELDKHKWCSHCMGLYQMNQQGNLLYQIQVEEFAYKEKSWYNLFWDWVRRIV